MAERFFGEMLEAGITPDVQALNSLINAFSKAGSPDQALRVFGEMSRYGVTPSLITFNSLIDACARAGDNDRARQMFSRLVQSGLSPNDRTFSAMIHSYAVKGEVGSELRVALQSSVGMQCEGHRSGALFGFSSYFWRRRFGG